MNWFVLYTKSRNEKLVASNLKSKGFEVYCPTIHRRKQWSDRIKVIEEPLFRSYCFVRLAEHERNQVFGVPGVVRYLFWQNKPAIVRDQEIESIRQMLWEAPYSTIIVQPLRTGDQLTISSGVFKHSTATVIRHENRIITVLLHSMQVMLKIDLATTAITD